MTYFDDLKIFDATLINTTENAKKHCAIAKMDILEDGKGFKFFDIFTRNIYTCIFMYSYEGNEFMKMYTGDNLTYDEIYAPVHDVNRILNYCRRMQKQEAAM